MITTILKTSVLNDDTLYQAEDNKVFSGNYVAILEYYTYASHWHNRKHVKRFRTLETMQKFINKNYKRI